MTSEELELAVRAECGKVESDKELHEDDIVREGVFILNRIDEAILDTRLRSFTGTINIREYDPHDNTVRVIKVYPSDSRLDNSLVLGTHHAASCNSDADENYLWPSLQVIGDQRRVRGLPYFKWGWNHIRRKITIDPMPSQTGDNYWYKSAERVEWTLSNLPVDLEELLVTGTVWKCLEIVIGKRSSLGGIHREGGFANYPGATLLSDWVVRKKDEFDALLIKKAAIYGSR